MAAAGHIQLHRRKVTLMAGIGVAMTCFVAYTILGNRTATRYNYKKPKSSSGVVDNQLASFLANVVVDKRFMETICQEFDVESCAPR